MNTNIKRIIYGLYLVLTGGLLGCQESTEEVSLPSDLIEIGSPLASSVNRMVSLDGSFDNAIDNGSCISVKLPVEIVVNEQALTIQSVADIQLVEQILNEQEFDFDTINFTFPIEVIQSDYSEVIVSSYQQLVDLRNQCAEGGVDDDNECVDFNFPISFKLYDSKNQRFATQTLEGDGEVFQFLQDFGTFDIVTLDFPIALTLVGGVELVVNSNVELEEILGSNAGLCEENDILFYDNPLPIAFGTGELKLLLTDAPFPSELVAEANITVDSIEIRIAEEDENFLLLSTENQSFNLLDLSNGITAALADLEIPEGFYDEIRLFVSESTVLLEDGTLFDLKVPSGKIKVKLDPSIEIEEAETTEVLLDFDVSRSFVVEGNPDTPAGIKGFLFKPVIKAVDLSLTGSLSGHVEDIMLNALEGAQISVFAADTLNTSTFTDGLGNYAVLGLLPGSYDVITELKDFESDTVQDVIIELATTTVVDFQMIEN